MDDITDLGMYSADWAPKDKPANKKFEIMHGGKKCRIIKIDGNNFEVPNKEYVEELEQKIVGLEKDLREMKNTLNRLSNHHNKLVETVNTTRQALDNKLDIVERD